MRYHGEQAIEENGEIPVPELGEPHDTFDWVADHDWFEDWMFDLTPEEKQKLADDPEKWLAQIKDYRGKYEYLLQAMLEHKKYVAKEHA